MARARGTFHAESHETPMHSTDQLLRRILTDVLGLKAGQADGFTAETGLFGHLPELDSMAVAGLLTEMEDRLELLFTQYSEGDVSAEDFAWFSERMPQHRREVIARTFHEAM